jgi:hypothetical protein
MYPVASLNNMVTLPEVQIVFSTIHAVAGSLVPRLSSTGLEKDIVLSAGLAGLRMLRESQANLANIAPGTVVLGAVPDAEAQTMRRFISSYASTNGIAKPTSFHVPEPWKPYLPELSRYEAALLDVCRQHAVDEKFSRFVGACAAVKLVLAGRELKTLSPETGIVIALYHVIAGSKTMPYPA